VTDEVKGAERSKRGRWRERGRVKSTLVKIATERSERERERVAEGN
jgi:hypothetical protein